MDINELKDLYKGHRAFIIGNGPSLTPEILDRLALTKWATFGMNRIAWLYSKTFWRPKFYIGLTTALWDVRHRADILVGIRYSEIAICWDLYKGYLDDDYNVVYVHCNEDAVWSDDISISVNKFAVMAYPTMEIATYMGFNPLYLIGCDGDYKPPVDGIDVSHFDSAYRPFDAYPGYNYDKLNLDLQQAHELAQVAADRLGIKIFNLSPDSKITTHSFMSLDEALNGH